MSVSKECLNSEMIVEKNIVVQNIQNINRENVLNIIADKNRNIVFKI